MHRRGRVDEPELERPRRILRELEKRGDLVRLGRGGMVTVVCPCGVMRNVPKPVPRKTGGTTLGKPW